jgi:olefin beta-lactone synthetase
MAKAEELRNKYFGFYDGRDSRNNVISLLQKRVREQSDKILLQWPEQTFKPEWGDTVIENIPHQSVTFGQFFHLVQRTASGLLKVGVKHGDCVILFVPMSLYLYQAMSAIMLIGARAVFLDSWARRGQLGVSAQIVAPTTMISLEQAFEFTKDVPEITAIPIKIVIGPHKNKYTATFDEVQSAEPIHEIAAVEGDETALVTFTTGSSGVPKGADRTHQFLVAQHVALDDAIPYKDSDIDLPAFPIFSLNNIAAGVNTVVPITDIGRPTEKDSLMLVSQILSSKVTCATLSPSMVANLAKYCDEKKITLPAVRRVITGGAPISNDVLALFKKCVPNAAVWVLYGSTEVEPIAHIVANDILKPKHGGSADREGVNVGHFAEGLEYKLIKINKANIVLVNDSWAGLEVSRGEVGELIVAGLHVCKNYYNDKNAVKRAKIVESTGKVWHRTGDLAWIDEHKNVWLVGRVHNAIVRKGEYLFPVKVEILMKKNSDVKQAAFLGVPDPQLGEKAIALVALVDKPGLDKNEIIANLKKSLEKAKVPCDYLGVIDSIPMDPRHHSKVEYDVLRERVLKEGIVK